MQPIFTMNDFIYLDYNSTTPVDKRVLEFMLPYFNEKFGNAASNSHAFGWIAKNAVDSARKKIAQLINCLDQEIIFTSGATEAINLAIKGVFEAYQKKGNHIITFETEHKAVLDTCKNLEKKGARITFLSVDKYGNIDLEELKKNISDKTMLVAVMLANNETGLIHPIKKMAEIVHEKGSILMCDATQAVGKIPVDVQAEHIDLMCLSAHKFYGPKGIGALYVRRKNPRVTLISQMDGGGHERGIRSGTLNVPAIVGFGKAAEIAQIEMNLDAEKLFFLRNELEKNMLNLGNFFVNGTIRNRLPNTSNICFKGTKADDIIVQLKNIALATGSACCSAIAAPSHVLKAMNLSNEDAYSSIRFSLGKYTTQSEINSVIKEFEKIFSKN